MTFCNKLILRIIFRRFGFQICINGVAIIWLKSFQITSPSPANITAVKWGLVHVKSVIVHFCHVYSSCIGGQLKFCLLLLAMVQNYQMPFFHDIPSSGTIASLYQVKPKNVTVVDLFSQENKPIIFRKTIQNFFFSYFVS